LRDLKGELKDHHIKLSIEESREPVTNIGAGIRWLHYKKLYAKRINKNEATWEDAVIFYKGLHGQVRKNSDADRIMSDIRKFLIVFKKYVRQKDEIFLVFTSLYFPNG